MAITGLSFVINNGAAYTNNAMVSVKVSFNIDLVNDVYWRIAKESGDLATLPYEELVSGVTGDIIVTKTTYNDSSITIDSVNTDPGGTTKYLYLQVREGLITESAIVSSSIIYDNIAPSFTLSFSVVS